MMEIGSQKATVYWQRDKKSMNDLIDFIVKIRARVFADETLRLEPLEIDSIYAAHKLLPDRTGKGIDDFGPADFKSLPALGAAYMLDVLRQCEEHLSWPIQIWTTLIALLAMMLKGLLH